MFVTATAGRLHDPRNVYGHGPCCSHVAITIETRLVPAVTVGKSRCCIVHGRVLPFLGSPRLVLVSRYDVLVWYQGAGEV
jgi:hypothetical protein